MLRERPRVDEPSAFSESHDIDVPRRAFDQPEGEQAGSADNDELEPLAGGSEQLAERA